ncbi:MAG: spermine/spermidine synthase domain-containing protein, partial [Halobacteriota archaeon]
MKMTRPRSITLGIALIACSTLMIELAINKALSFSTWGSLGYMIIGSAIFGYAIAGVILGVWRPDQRYDTSRLLGFVSLLYACSIALAHVVMNEVPLNFEDFATHPVNQVLYFITWYVVLLIPFSSSGFIIALILTEFSSRANRLYAADLIGAGIGCLAVVPLFPLVGPSGQYMISSAMGALAALCFFPPTLRAVRLVCWIAAIVFFATSVLVENIYPVETHQAKRERMDDYTAGNISMAHWSFLSKIEVALRPDERSGMIWFDGGLMQSAIDQFDGNFEEARMDSRIRGANSLPYRLRDSEDVLIIAPAGGREVRAALAWGASNVTGVELDPTVVSLVQNDISNYLGDLYRDDRVTLINDEGRSFVRHSGQKYDVIQFVSAYSVEAIHAGATNLATSYLVTEESFTDYLDHLKSDGILAISRDLNLRLYFLAWRALEQRGLEASSRLVLLRNDGGTLGRNTLLVSLEPFTEHELTMIASIAKAEGMQVNYAPHALMNQVDVDKGLMSEPKTRNIIETFVGIANDQRSNFLESLPFDVSTVSDDRPFFNDFRYITKDLKTYLEDVPEEIAEYVGKTWYVPYLPIGYLARVVVLCVAAILGVLFLIFPLVRWQSAGIQTGQQKLGLIFFLALGLGFMWIEIVLIKTFTLFLGSPVYSISIVLFALLVSAGVGSFVSSSIPGSVSVKLMLVWLAILVAVCTMVSAYPQAFKLFLGADLSFRLVIAIVMILPVGFVLG